MFYDENALCVIYLYICTGSFGHKYFILNRDVFGSFYIGNQDELIGSDVAITGNSVQTPSSPLLRPLKQDQFSFDMELCDIVTITKGSFIVAEMSTPQNGKYIYLLVLYNLKTEISHILKFQMIWEQYSVILYPYLHWRKNCRLLWKTTFAKLCFHGIIYKRFWWQCCFATDPSCSHDTYARLKFD